MHKLIQISLKLPLQLTWRRGADMPFGMTDYAQSVVVQEKVYVGGRNAYSDSNSYTVMEYDMKSEKWNTLPPYRAKDFAMVVVRDHLMLVGGREHDKKPTKIISRWNANHLKWTQPYRDMPIARFSCSAVAYNEWLIVAGGEAHHYLASVEMLNTDMNEWHSGPPLPVPLCDMKTAKVGDIFYFMGGFDNGYCTDKVYSASIHTLCSSERGPMMWKEIPGLQLYKSAPLSISGSLLSVGGKDKDFEAVTAIYLYEANTGAWVKVGGLPSSCHDCACVINSQWEVLVFGAWNTVGVTKMMRRLDIASLS